MVALAMVSVGVLAWAQEPELVPRVEPGQLLSDAFRSPSAERPDTHRGDFPTRHGVAARADAAACKTCHTEASCLGCHNDPSAQAVHPPGFLAYHPIDARADAGSCASCHAPETFCKDCHQVARFTSSGPSQLAPGVGFHPASWLGVSPGPEHGRAARRNLTSCTTCHTETDCVRCHAGINPHPPGWTRSCGSLVRSNAQACARCHVDVQRVVRLCDHR
jgi:hypothetical protein